MPLTKALIDLRFYLMPRSQQDLWSVRGRLLTVWHPSFHLRPLEHFVCYIPNYYIIHNAYPPVLPNDEQWLVHCFLATRPNLPIWFSIPGCLRGLSTALLIHSEVMGKTELMQVNRLTVYTKPETHAEIFSFIHLYDQQLQNWYRWYIQASSVNGKRAKRRSARGQLQRLSSS